MGHHGGRGMMAAAMLVHRVFTIYEHVCCVLCMCCTYEYFHMVKLFTHKQFIPPVAGGKSHMVDS